MLDHWISSRGKARPALVVALHDNNWNSMFHRTRWLILAGCAPLTPWYYGTKGPSNHPWRCSSALPRLN
eukprot:8111962-Lingulodinium_polyedra.AAC.1